MSATTIWTLQLFGSQSNALTMCDKTGMCVSFRATASKIDRLKLNSRLLTPSCWMRFRSFLIANISTRISDLFYWVCLRLSIDGRSEYEYVDAIIHWGQSSRTSSLWNTIQKHLHPKLGRTGYSRHSDKWILHIYVIVLALLAIKLNRIAHKTKIELLILF